MRRKLLLAAFFVLLVGCDQISKHAATEHLQGEPLVLVRGAFDFRYTENHDTAFSAFRTWTGHRPNSAWPLALALAALAIMGGAVWKQRNELTKRQHWAAVMVASGGVANLVDRIAHGYVVDFMDVRYWPVFNIADVLIVVGVVLWILPATLRRTRSPPTQL